MKLYLIAVVWLSASEKTPGKTHAIQEAEKYFTKEEFCVAMDRESVASGRGLGQNRYGYELDLDRLALRRVECKVTPVEVVELPK